MSWKQLVLVGIWIGLTAAGRDFGLRFNTGCMGWGSGYPNNMKYRHLGSRNTKNVQYRNCLREAMLRFRQDSNFQCPDRYVLKEGDIPGWGQIGHNKTVVATITDCSNMCNNEPNCCSFEYSRTDKKCNLNTGCIPTQNKYLDYRFCAKGKTPLWYSTIFKFVFEIFYNFKTGN